MQPYKRVRMDELPLESGAMLSAGDQVFPDRPDLYQRLPQGKLQEGATLPGAFVAVLPNGRYTTEYDAQATLAVVGNALPPLAEREGEQAPRPAIINADDDLILYSRGAFHVHVNHVGESPKQGAKVFWEPRTWHLYLGDEYAEQDNLIDTGFVMLSTETDERSFVAITNVDGLPAVQPTMAAVTEAYNRQFYAANPALKPVTETETS